LLQSSTNTRKNSKENRIEIEHIRSKHAFRKEDCIKEILTKRGTHEGIVHVFSVMEPCPAYTSWRDKQSGKTILCYKRQMSALLFLLYR